MKCRDRILGKVLNDDVAKVVMMFVGLWLLGTLMSHAQTSLSSKQDIGKRHELYFGVGCKQSLRAVLRTLIKIYTFAPNFKFGTK